MCTSKFNSKVILIATPLQLKDCYHYLLTIQDKSVNVDDGYGIISNLKLSDKPLRDEREEILLDLKSSIHAEDFFKVLLQKYEFDCVFQEKDLKNGRIIESPQFQSLFFCKKLNDCEYKLFFEKHEEVEYRFIGNEKDLLRFFNDIIEIRNAYWQGKEYRDFFPNDSIESFIRSILPNEQFIHPDGSILRMYEHIYKWSDDISYFSFTTIGISDLYHPIFLKIAQKYNLRMLFYSENLETMTIETNDETKEMFDSAYTVVTDCEEYVCSSFEEMANVVEDVTGGRPNNTAGLLKIKKEYQENVDESFNVFTVSLV